jgi:hypothetical protein
LISKGKNMKALISPLEGPITHITGWTLNPDPTPGRKYFCTEETYPNSCRVAEVMPDDQIFGVAEPLFWVSCPDDCVRDQWWYDLQANTIQPIVNAPLPE